MFFNPSSDPLTPEDLEFIDEILMKYGNDDSILSASELDGFVTAIVSSPDMIPPSRWMPEIWGGADFAPEWESEDEFHHFIQLVMQHMNFVIDLLMHQPDDYVAMFVLRKFNDREVVVVEDWCFGYMHGVDLGHWIELPEELAACLYAIELHGRGDNFSVLETLSIDEHQTTTADIEPAVRRLYAYWFEQRTGETLSQQMPFGQMQPRQEPVRIEPTVGRNELCPCGSGKKYKRCCLH